jgi:hypothetical protein
VGLLSRKVEADPALVKKRTVLRTNKESVLKKEASSIDTLDIKKS